MKRLKRLSPILLVLAACSSDPTVPGYSPREDSGGNPFADATPQDVVYGEVTFDSVSSETSDDAADALDATVGDGSTADAPSDSAEVGDARPDAAPDAADTSDGAIDPALEQSRCTAGSPRLAWSGTYCNDWHPPSGGPAAPIACAFARHADGSLRCLPILRGPVVGYTTGTCSPVGVWIDTGNAVAGLAQGVAFVTVNEADGPHVRLGAVSGPPTTWYRMISGTCTKSTALYIWKYGNQTASGGTEVPAASFALATF